MSIPVSRPSIRRKDMDSVLSCMVSDKIEPGTQNEEFVASFLDYLDAEGGLAFREPLTAVRHALAALDLPRAARVALPVLAPSFYLDAIASLGLEAYLLDVELESSLPSGSELISLAEQEKISAFVLSSPGGQLMDSGFFEGFRLPILEDASYALGGEYSDGSKVGSKGNVSVIRTEAEDIVTSAGGMVVICRAKKELKALAQASEGLDKSALLSDMNAALGKIQLKSLKDYATKRLEIYEVLLRAAMRSPAKVLIPRDESKPVPQGFHIRLALGLAEARSYALKKGVETSMTFADSVFHRLLGAGEAASGTDPVSRFPLAAQLQLQTLRLPLYPSMSAKELDLIQKVVATLP